MACHKRSSHCTSLVKTRSTYLKSLLTKSQMPSMLLITRNLNFWSIKARNKVHWPDIWTQSRTWQQVSKWVVIISMTLQLYEYQVSCHRFLLMLWPWQRSNWSGWCMQQSSWRDISSVMIKIFQTRSWQFVPPSKVPTVKTFYDRGHLETKSGSKLWHAIKGLVIVHLGCKYQVST